MPTTMLLYADCAKHYGLIEAALINGTVPKGLGMTVHSGWIE